MLNVEQSNTYQWDCGSLKGLGGLNVVPLLSFTLGGWMIFLCDTHARTRTQEVRHM